MRLEDLTDLDIKRFFTKVGKPDGNGCQLWLGWKSSKQCYGRLRLSLQSKYSRRRLSIAAHRLAWMLENEKDLRSTDLICHTCDNPLCVNPDHLVIGTNTSNMCDMVEKGRSLRGSKSPTSVLTEKDVVDIKVQYDSREATRTDLARRFGVTRQTIDKIINGSTWKHIVG